MAGGSQIIISSDGITIKTPREFKVFAGQHIFQSGQQVPISKASLPMMKTPFSNQVNYNWNVSSQGEKEIFIVDKNNGKLIKHKKNEVDSENKLSSLRFYTENKVNFTALGFDSTQTSLIQQLSNQNNIDELIEEVEEEDQDDVYTEEDI